MAHGNIKVKIRPSQGPLFDFEFDPSEMTVFELKELLATQIDGITADKMRLVYSGKVLKDDDQCDAYNIGTGHTIHLVKAAANNASQQAAQGVGQTGSGRTASGLSTGSSALRGGLTASNDTLSNSASSRQMPQPGAMRGFGGMPNMDPEMIRSMMDNPFVQSILDNPGKSLPTATEQMMRSMMMSNPQIQSMIEQNPEIGHLINDPSFLRQSMQMMRNPELMREMQRNNDRALSNIEAIPGGFNHLRRMYSTMLEPLDAATRPGENSSDEAANRRMAERLNVVPMPENQPNNQALPNPWAPPPSQTRNRATSPTSNGRSPIFTPEHPFARFLSPNNDTANQGSSPSFLSPQQLSDPYSQFDVTPSTQGNTTTNEATPFWMNPDVMRAAAQLQQTMMQQQNNSFDRSELGFPPSPPSPFLQPRSAPFNPFVSPVFNQPPPAPTLSEPPEQRFASQLSALSDMGFVDSAANIRALLATGGDVNAAVEYLLRNQ